MTTEFKINGTQNAEVELNCSKCVPGKKVHRVLVSVEESGADGNPHREFYWHTSYQVVQCQGCRLVSFRSAATDSESVDHDDYGQTFAYVTERLYPARLSGRQGLGMDVWHLPPNAKLIYAEVVQSLTNQSPVLAGVGLRALVEVVCKEKKAKGSNLLDQIDSLVAARVLTPSSADILHKVRNLGNKAAHEVTPHTDAQLEMALDVVEHLLRDVYILPKKTETIFEGKPNPWFSPPSPAAATGDAPEL